MLRRVEMALYSGAWAVKAARALGPTPIVRTTQLQVQGMVPMPPGLAYLSPSRPIFMRDQRTDPEVLRLACAALRAADADILLLGGDFVNFAARDADALIGELALARTRYGRFAVLGNHDWAADASHIADRLQRAGIEVLTNRNVRLPAPFEHVWICGLDDHCFGLPDADAAFTGAEGFRIVLMHEPSDYWISETTDSTLPFAAIRTADRSRSLEESRSWYPRVRSHGSMPEGSTAWREIERLW